MSALTGVDSELPASTAAVGPAEATPADAAPHVRIRPTGRWQVLSFADLWAYRELLVFLVWRDVKVRYRQTALGMAWAVLQPVLMMAAFTVFFGKLAGLPTGGVPYPLFAFAGLIPWLFFAAAVSTAGNSVVGSERLVTKIYFPRIVIPFAAVGAAVVDFLIAFVVFVLVAAGYAVAGHPVPLGPSLLLGPVAYLFIVLAGLGVGTALAALNVKYRDFKYVIPFLVQFWMFATPTVYMQPAAEPDSLLSWVLWLNPMTGLIGSFRAAFLGLPVPWVQLAVSAATVTAVFFAGCAYFRKVEGEFADVI
jgi:lipopolysaccharide transport system permease protein